MREVLGPTIEIESERIVVTFTVEALDSDGANKCPGNPPVAATVDLGEPRGDRPIVDGTCLEKLVNFMLHVCELDGERVSTSGSAVTDLFAVQG